MAPTRKRDNRENQFYDVGVQGRKTGITLADSGKRDEHGLEPISGIFSSPEKSPPKRRAAAHTSETVTGSESMEIQESSIPELATSAHILRNSRTHLPPPKSRSPMKTALGSSPRRHTSVGPRQSAVNGSSPLRGGSQPAVSRRLNFDQEESTLQETPALKLSGQRRGKRRDVYDIDAAVSPTHGHSAMLEESLQEEITANEDSATFNGVVEESYVADIGNETMAGAEADASVEVEESEIVIEPAKQPAKRGRKRKSEAMEPAAEEEEEVPKTRRRGAAAAKAPEPPKNAKKAAPPPAAAPRRSKRVSDMTEEEPSTFVDASPDVSEQVDDAPVAPKARGRPRKVIPQAEKTAATETKAMKAKGKEKQTEEQPVFKKPAPIAKPKKKVAPESDEKQSDKEILEGGKLVDVHGKPIPQAELDQMSTTSAGSRYGRGRQLSVFRELEPDAVARIGRTGRHRVKPIDFWRNEGIIYDTQRNMQAIVKSEAQEPAPRKTGIRRTKGSRRGLSAIEEEEEIELEPWEEEDGIFVGLHRDFDPTTELSSDTLLENPVAWAQKGINPVDVGDASFKFTKLGSAGEQNFLSWGFIELLADQMKRSKNSRRMHMVFHVQSGAVEVKVHENVFTVHRGGVFQVPRGNTYSIKNVSHDTSRVFFAQAQEHLIQTE